MFFDTRNLGNITDAGRRRFGEKFYSSGG